MGFSEQGLFRIQKFFAIASAATHPQLVLGFFFFFSQLVFKKEKMGRGCLSMQSEQPAHLEKGQTRLQTAPPTLFFFLANLQV